MAASEPVEQQGSNCTQISAAAKEQLCEEHADVYTAHYSMSRKQRAQHETRL